jgi:hypothetical protein
MAPIAAALMVGLGWANALQVMGLIVLLCLPAAFLLRAIRCRRRRRAKGQGHARGHRHRAAQPQLPLLAWAFSSAAFTWPSWPRTCRA